MSNFLFQLFPTVLYQLPDKLTIFKIVNLRVVMLKIQ